jgi:predicted O-linked N-acetylglucosamine transferase (SPINDLY family)
MSENQKITKELEEKFEKIKYYYENKEYYNVLNLSKEFIEKDIMNEYLYQIISSIYFTEENFNKALEFTNKSIEKYNSISNYKNKIKILKKQGEDKNIEEIKKIYLKIIPYEPNVENLIDYINLEKNILISNKLLEQLLENNKIDEKVYNTAFNFLIFYIHVYDKINLMLIIKNNLKKKFNLEEITDEILIQNLDKCKNTFEYFYMIYILTKPSILYNNENEILLDRNRVYKNLDILIKYFENRVLFDKVDNLLLQWHHYFYYYFCYNGLNNSLFYKKISQFFRTICKDLIYESNNLIKCKENNKIKIGFLSSFIFENHSVCRDRIGLIRSMISDERFEVYLITYKNQESEIYKAAISKNYKNKIIVPKNIDKARTIIENLNLNIIIYPEIGMDMFFYLLSYSRLAPIQINTWGHSETSGIDTIDYYFSSKYYEDESHMKNYSEKLILLDSLSTYYYNISIFGFDYNKFNKKELLTYFNLPHNCNIYGVLQTVFKYHPNNIDIIKEILYNDPKALIIILNYDKLEERFFEYLENKLGYHMNRVRLINRLGKIEYCKLLFSIDIILDSYPFGGCNSSLDAFYMNKIVITLPSEKLYGRFTLGFYKKMGILEPICRTKEEFINKSLFYMNNIHERRLIEEKINSQKYKLFEEKESLDTWKDKLILLNQNI